MTSKIRIKIGDVEVEYEGTEDFLRDELPALLSAVLELHRERGSNTGHDDNGGASPNGNGSVDVETGTVTTIAAKLRPSTGSDLAVAAAARLVIGLAQSSFTRKELLTEMKNATSYYKQSYGSNLSATLKTLIQQDKFREIASGKYALSSTERNRLEAQLAG